MKAVILAGGKGRRLLPYTTSFPKPLMPIGEKPILEILIGKLRDSGIKEIIIATGHLQELITAFFQDGSRFGVSITYSKEDQPLGTAGPLGLVRDQLDETFLLMNGDVLSDVDYSVMVAYHKDRGATATVGLCRRSVDIDFGVVSVDDQGSFVGWTEKPRIEYLVSMGIYVVEPRALELLPANGFINLPDLILLIASSRQKVCTYTHRGYWLDIGRAEDYQKACEDHERNCGV